MGDIADAIIDDIIQAMAEGYCPDCDSVCDPLGPCRCDELRIKSKMVKRHQEG